MPFIDADPLARRRTLAPAARAPRAPAAPIDPSRSVMGAAMRAESGAVALGELAGAAFAPGDPDTSPILTPEDVVGQLEGSPMWDYRHRFESIRTQAEFDMLTRRIEDELADQRVLEDAGGWGMAARMAASLASPSTLLPGGALVKGSKAAQIGANALRVGGAAALGTALDEALLQGTQETRTAGESALAVGGSLVIGAALGAGLTRLLGRSPEGVAAMKSAAGEVEALTRAPDVRAAQEAAANDLNAAAVPLSTLEQETARGLSDGARRVVSPGWLNIGAQLTTSPAAATRSFAREVLEIPLITKGADDVGRGVSLETGVKVTRDAALIRARRVLDDAYAPAAKTGMTKGDFLRGVATAMRNRDVGATPEITAAARGLRADISALADRAAQQGLYGPDVKTVDDLVSLGAPSYFPRIWQRPELIRRRTEFLDRMVAHLQSGKDPMSVDEARMIADDVHKQLTSVEREVQPFAPIMVRSGPLKDRTLNVRDEDFADFLDANAERVATRYIRQMSAQVEMAERGLSRDAIRAKLDEIHSEYNRLIAKAGDAKSKTKLARQRDADVRALHVSMDELMGVGPSARFAATPLGQFLANTSAFSFVTILGNHALSAAPDMVRAGAQVGLSRAVGDALPALGRALKRVVKPGSIDTPAARLAADVGIAEDILSVRFMGGDRMLSAADRSRVAEALDWASDAVSRFSGMDAMSQGAKEMALAGIAGRIGDAAKAGDDMPAAVADIFRRANVNAAERRRIMTMMREHGGYVDAGSRKLFDPRLAEWSDQRAAQAFRGVLRAEVDTVIVTPGLADLPLWARENPLLRPLLQFKSFFLAGSSRLAVTLLQTERRAALAQALAMVTMGMFVDVAKNLQSGREPTLEPGALLAAGIDRAGVVGWLMEANNIAEAAGAPGLYRLLGEDRGSSRYAARGLVDSLLGPQVGLLYRGADTLSSAAKGSGIAGADLTPEQRGAERARVVGNVLRLLPGGELPGIKSALDLFVEPNLKEAVK